MSKSLIRVALLALASMICLNWNVMAVAGTDKCAFNAAAVKPSDSHYLSDVVRHEKIVRFDPNKMPIRVYLRDDRSVPGWNATHVQAVKEAMTVWEQALKGKVKFLVTSDPNHADIHLHWVLSIPEKSGNTHSKRSGCYVRDTEITLAIANNKTGKYYTATRLKGVAIHEFGHALGFKGHSPHPDDVMSSSGKHPAELSTRDINTMRLIYGLPLIQSRVK